MEMNRQIFTIEQVNNYVKSLMDKNPVLQNLWIRGEISNFKLHSSGHMYFTLKDNQARIKCVFFKNYAYSLNFVPTDGMSVIVREIFPYIPGMGNTNYMYNIWKGMALVNYMPL